MCCRKGIPSGLSGEASIRLSQHSPACDTHTYIHTHNTYTHTHEHIHTHTHAQYTNTYTHTHTHTHTKTHTQTLHQISLEHATKICWTEQIIISLLNHQWILQTILWMHSCRSVCFLSIPLQTKYRHFSWLSHIIQYNTSEHTQKVQESMDSLC